MVFRYRVGPSVPFCFMIFEAGFFLFFCGIQNKRGGRVKLLPIVMPLTEFDHPEKGDALYGKD